MTGSRMGTLHLETKSQSCDGQIQVLTVWYKERVEGGGGGGGGRERERERETDRQTDRQRQRQRER